MHTPSACPARIISTPAAAAPSVPLTQTSSPAAAPLRVSQRRDRTSPPAVTSITSGPSVLVMFPPTTETP
jgi:hypothetical protein